MLKIFYFITVVVTVIISYFIIKRKISSKYGVIPIIMAFIILFLIPNIQK